MLGKPGVWPGAADYAADFLVLVSHPGRRRCCTGVELVPSGRRRTARETIAADDPIVPDVADAVVTLDERGRVRAALAKLPSKQAVALVLRHSGLSYADVAAALDLSPGSVGTTIRRAESAL